MAAVPDAVRLVLTLAPGQAIQGTLTRDWVRGAIGGGK
jgi:general secretion pathway protein J